mmetsp:Transcript_47103/g.114474  ORF Transcript_47103/g.114474 Transcript_47103/m.114474 type:complete len:260 (-) Transcript_47103:1702-2481(-)
MCLRVRRLREGGDAERVPPRRAEGPPEQPPPGGAAVGGGGLPDGERGEPFDLLLSDAPPGNDARSGGWVPHRAGWRAPDGGGGGLAGRLARLGEVLHELGRGLGVSVDPLARRRHRLERRLAPGQHPRLVLHLPPLGGRGRGVLGGGEGRGGGAGALRGLPAVQGSSPDGCADLAQDVAHVRVLDLPGVGGGRAAPLLGHGGAPLRQRGEAALGLAHAELRVDAAPLRLVALAQGVLEGARVRLPQLSDLDRVLLPLAR